MEWTPLWTRGGQEEGAPTCRAQSKARGMHLAAAKRRGTAQPDCESTRPATPIGRSIEANSRARSNKAKTLTCPCTANAAWPNRTSYWACSRTRMLGLLVC